MLVRLFADCSVRSEIENFFTCFQLKVFPLAGGTFSLCVVVANLQTLFIFQMKVCTMLQTLPVSPQPAPPGNHFSTLCFYEFGLFFHFTYKLYLR